jgi:hypothetical protein
MSNPNSDQITADSGEEPTGIHYHYTDQRGILGIIESQTIWASHVRYLNDSSEFNLGWSKSWEKLESLIEQCDFANKESLKKVFNRQKRTISELASLTSYYVWCLTDDEVSAVQHH